MKLYCNKSFDENTYFHSRIYDDFVKDYRHDKNHPFIHYPEEYNGEKIIKLCCSQHSKVVDGVETISDYQRKKITKSWIKCLEKPDSMPLKEVQVCTRMSQDVFDALCNQTSIESLRIKSFTGKDISRIKQLTNLKKLFIESASGIDSIKPIAYLANLEVLILGETKKITDYSEFGRLKNVKVFSICSYRTRETILHMENDSFMADMTSLEFVDMCDVRIENQVFLKPNNVENIDFAVFYIRNEN